MTTENSFFSPLNNEGDLSQECYANVKLEQIKFLELPHFQPAKVQILDNSALLSKKCRVKKDQHTRVRVSSVCTVYKPIMPFPVKAEVINNRFALTFEGLCPCFVVLLLWF